MKKRVTSLILVVTILLLTIIPGAFAESPVQTFSAPVTMEYESGGSGWFTSNIATATFKVTLRTSNTTPKMFIGAEFPTSSGDFPKMAIIGTYAVAATVSNKPTYANATITPDGQTISIVISGGNCSLTYKAYYSVSAYGVQTCTKQETITRTFYTAVSYKCN